MKYGRFNYRAALLCWMLLLTIGIAPSLACDAVWYTSQGTAQVLGDDSDKARQAAMEAAGMSAIGMALSGVTLDSMLATARLSGDSMSLIPFIKVESGEILDESRSRPKQAGDKALFKVKMRTALCSIASEPDMKFRLSVSLNKSAFYDNDEMQIQIRSTHDCHYAVYIITVDGEVSRLIPSRLKEKNVLKAGEMVIFPDDHEKGRGIRLRAHTPLDGSVTNETVFILALQKEKLVTTENMDEAIYGLYDGQSVQLKELIQRVAVIPIEHRAEYLIRYSIHPQS